MRGPHHTRPAGTRPAPALPLDACVRAVERELAEFCRAWPYLTFDGHTDVTGARATVERIEAVLHHLRELQSLRADPRLW